MKPRPWYRSLGPVSWYRREWVALDLTWGNRIIALITWKPGRAFTAEFGGVVHSRSRCGRAASIEPRWSLAWFSAEVRERQRRWEANALELIDRARVNERAVVELN